MQREIRSFMRVAVLLVCICTTVFLFGCRTETTESDQSAASRISEEVVQMTLTSTAFAEGERIPDRYTCSGEDISPALAWADASEGTRSFALICDDPDAPRGIWVHWVLYNIPASCSSLPEAIPADSVLSDGSRHGMTDFGRSGYGGPCPPRGAPHRYFFKLYALDFMPDAVPGLTKEGLLAAIDGHILAEARLMGTFSRQ